jgi:toluene monooxygenase system ferredoxin subunit
MAGRWRNALNIDELWEGEMTAVTVSGQPVLLINIDGGVRAYSNRCPHQASPLSEGNLDGQTLTCGRHLWQFNALTGRGINPAKAQLQSYSCEVAEDGTIYGEIEG